MRSVWGAPLLGVLAVQERISDLGAGKALAAGRVAWVAEGKLWVKDLPDGKARQLAAGEDISRPAWSPTGRWLLFRRGEDLWLVGVGRGEARCMAQGVDEFAWSPATDVFAFTAGGELCAGEPAKDGLRTLVKREPGVDIGRIAWSPDGKWVALERQKIEPGVPGYAGIWKVDATSGAMKRVYSVGLSPDEVESSFGIVPRLADWSPDGQMVLFWLGPLSGSLAADGLALYLAPAGGCEAPQPLVGSEPDSWEAVLVQPDFLAAGAGRDRLVVICGGGRETWTNKRLAVYNFRTGKLTYLARKDQAVVSAAFSPDGRFLVYSAGPEIKETETEAYGRWAHRALAGRRLWVVDTDGGKPRRLTNDPAYRDERPLFSADGRYILFVRLDGEDKASLWLVRPDGSGLERVVEEIGPLTEEFAFGYYGAVAWGELFAYWPGVADAALINAAKGTPEAKKLLARYPWAQVLVDRSGKPAVDFRVDKLESGGEPGPYLRLRVFIDPATNTPGDRFEPAEVRVGLRGTRPAFADMMFVQTQTYCKQSPDTFGRALDRLLAQFGAGGTSVPWFAQISVDPEAPNGVPAVRAVECARVAWSKRGTPHDDAWLHRCHHKSFYLPTFIEFGQGSRNPYEPLNLALKLRYTASCIHNVLIRVLSYG